MQRIASVTFTCKRDFYRAAFHARSLPLSWQKFWIVATDDERREAAGILKNAGITCEIIVAPFDRGGSLRGESAILGMRNVFLSVLNISDCNVLVKLDSDTHLFEPDAFTCPVLTAGADFVYIRRLNIESRLLANGCCYAMSRKAVLRLGKLKPPFPKNYSGHEDLIFSSFFTTQQRDLCLCQIQKMRWSWCENPYFSHDCLGAHNGYVSFEKDVEIVNIITRLRSSVSC